MAITYNTASTNFGSAANRTSYYTIDNTGLSTGVSHTPADFDSDVNTGFSLPSGAIIFVDRQNRLLDLRQAGAGGTGCDVYINGRWNDTGWTIVLAAEHLVTAGDSGEWTSGVLQNGQALFGANWRLPDPPGRNWSVFANSTSSVGNVNQGSSCNAQWHGITFDLIGSNDIKVLNERNTNSLSNLNFTVDKPDTVTDGFVLAQSSSDTVSSYNLNLRNIYLRLQNSISLDGLGMNGDPGTADGTERVRILITGSPSTLTTYPLNNFEPVVDSDAFVRFGLATGNNRVLLRHSTLRPDRIVTNRGSTAFSPYVILYSDFNVVANDLAGNPVSGICYLSSTPRRVVNNAQPDTLLDPSHIGTITVLPAQAPLDPNDSDNVLSDTVPSIAVSGGTGTDEVIISTSQLTGSPSPTDYTYGTFTDYRNMTLTMRAYGYSTITQSISTSTDFSRAVQLPFAMPQQSTANITETNARLLQTVTNTDELVAAIRVYELDNNIDVITVTGNVVDFGDRIIGRITIGDVITVNDSEVLVNTTGPISAGTATNSVRTTSTFVANTFAGNVSVRDASGPEVSVFNQPPAATIRTQFYRLIGGVPERRPFIDRTGNFSFNRSDPAFDSEITNMRVLSYGEGYQATSSDHDLTGADPVSIDLSTLQFTPYPNGALAGAGIGYRSTDTGSRIYAQRLEIVDSDDVDSERIVVHIEGGGNAPVLTDALTNEWMQKVIRASSEYGWVISRGAGGAARGDFIFSFSGVAGFGSASSLRLRFTPGSDTNSSYGLGFINNTVGALTTAFEIERNVNIVGGGTAALRVLLEPSPASFDSSAVDVSIQNADLATRADVNNARNVILGSV